MARRLLGVGSVVGLLAIAAALMLGGGSASSGNDNHTLKRVVLGELKAPTITSKSAKGVTVTRQLPFVSDAAVVAEQQALCDEAVIPNCDERAEGADATASGDLSLDGTGGGTVTGLAHSLGCGN